eukprot:4392269-Prymnesium_polylepis.1
MSELRQRKAEAIAEATEKAAALRAEKAEVQSQLKASREVRGAPLDATERWRAECCGAWMWTYGRVWACAGGDGERGGVP